MNRLVAFTALLTLGACGSVQMDRASQHAEIHAAKRPADIDAEQRGAAYAEARCASCHAIGRRGDSSLAAAPPFRSLGLRYPVEDLAEAFAEGIVAAHPAMPEFVLSSQENADLIAYLESIQSPTGL